MAEIIAASDFSVISWQVLNEFTAVCLKKNLMSLEKIREYVREYITCFMIETVNFTTVSQCFEIRKKYRYEWFDCLIIASALQCGCSILYSEDMQHKQVIENKLTIINPFV